MNERFKQLAEQAGMTRILDEHAHEYGNGMLENTQYPELEKFAELIVQDCIDILSPYTVNMNRIGEEYLHPIQEIKKNFGVKL